MRSSVILPAAGLVARAQPGAVPKFDEAAVERGRNAFVSVCGFCHGSNARGGGAARI